MRDHWSLASRRLYVGWFLLAVSVTVYVVISVQEPFYVGPRTLGYFDLRVYRDAAQLILSNRSLYGTPIAAGFHFTYPPFAALGLTPLVVGSLRFDEVVVTAINVAGLALLLRLTLTMANSSGRDRARAFATDRRWHLVAVAAAAAVWLEPVTTTLGYGQIDLIIATLIVFDLGRRDAAKSKGAAIGLASGLKLTPVIFVLYLCLTGRRRAAAVAIGVVAATVAVGFALLPSDARLYWGGYMFDASRVGTLPDSSNQSLQGAVARLMGTLSVNWQSIAAAGVVAAIGLAVAVRASRRGDEITGFSMCAIAGLLACPISWTHHWVLAVPALFLFAVRAYEERSRLMLIATGAVAAIGYSYAPERVIHLSLSPWSLASLPAADAYVLVGVSTIALGAWREISTCALARRMQTISTASGDGSFSTSLRGTPEPAFDIGKTPSGHTHAS